MMRQLTIIILSFVTIALCQYETIPVSKSLSKKTLDRLWPTFKGGAITINKREVIIPDGSSLYIQNRIKPDDYTRVDLKRHGADVFTVYEATANDEIYAYTVAGSDGRFYIFERGRRTGAMQGPAIRHGAAAERMFLLKNDKLVATGLYRPQLIFYLDLYKDDSIQKQIKYAKENFDPLYLKHKAYTVSVYDKYLTEIDSGNVINRIGDNARAYEGLYLTLAVDIADDETLYLIDNDQGYVVEKYSNLTKIDSSFEIINPNFKTLPDVMTLGDLDELRSRAQAYSAPYALYHKKGYLLTAFFQAPVRFRDVQPPYYYDISTINGESLTSGVLEYPFLCEDDGDKVFLYVKREGGWFQDDLHFLVGVTIEDLLTGAVTKATIDASIESLERW